MPKDPNTTALQGIAQEIKRLGMTVAVTNQHLAKLVAILQENQDGPGTAGQEEAVLDESAGESVDLSEVPGRDSEEQEG